MALIDKNLANCDNLNGGKLSMSRPISLGVFCSASSHLNPKYYEYARTFSKLMRENHCNLVYGGATIGIMGAIADELKKLGGHVTGIIPKVITNREIEHEGLDELIITEDMHERKKLLYKKSEMLVILPGGYGTLDEAFEAMTWNQLDIHKLPVAFINWFGYFDGIKQFCDTASKEKFTGVYDNFKPHFFNTNEDFFNWMNT